MSKLLLIKINKHKKCKYKHKLKHKLKCKHKQVKKANNSLNKNQQDILKN